MRRLDVLQACFPRVERLLYTVGEGIMTTTTSFDPDKFRELLLYVARRSVDDPRFGATKLNKILFYADFYSYGLRGKAITGASYQRLSRGPAPRQLLPIQRDLVASADAIVVKADYFGREQNRLFALRSPDLGLFSAEEIALVDEVIDIFRQDDATGVSRLSHQEMAWRIDSDGDDIPYEAIFLSNKTPTPADIARGRDLAAANRWHEAKRSKG
jgi:hypothetical protein